MAATHSLSLTAASSQYASIADASCPNLEISGSQTWMIWINPTNFADYRVMMAKAVGANTHDFFMGAAAKPVFRLAGLTTNSSVTYSGTLSAGVWVHVTGVYDSSASKLRLYINGELDQEVTASGSAVDTNGNFYIGANDGGTYFNGKLRNARIYASALTQAQIRSEMNVDTPTIATVGNWILNNAYTDSSGNGYTLTASGSPTFSTTYPDAIDLVENKTFTKKHKITVQHTQVAGSANLTDVPIVFTESNFLSEIFSLAKTAGADLRFSSDIDGKTRLAHEIVSFDKGTSKAEVWVKANTLDFDDNTDIYVHYGNATASALDENEAFGKHQVYPSAYKAVWHMGNATDSTSASNDGTATSVTFNTTNGKIVDGGGFDGTNSRITHGAIVTPIGAKTVGVWIKKPSNPAGTRWYLANLANSGIQYGLYVDLTSTGTTNFAVGRASGTPIFSVGTSALNNNQWYFAVLTWDGTTGSNAVKLYLDGVNVANATAAQTETTTPTSNLSIGQLTDGSARFTGSLDNLFMTNTALSADYISTIYNNQNSPSTFAIPQSTAGGAFLLQFV